MYKKAPPQKFLRRGFIYNKTLNFSLLVLHLHILYLLFILLEARLQSSDYNAKIVKAKKLFMAIFRHIIVS